MWVSYLAGVGLVFLILGALGQALLEFEFNNLFGRRRMEREIGKLKEHYIICGAGRVGRACRPSTGEQARSIHHP